MQKTSATNERLVQQYESSGGALVFCLPIEVFPNFSANVYLVQFESLLILIDCGSNFHGTSEQLEERLIEVSDLSRKKIDFGTLSHILITHGHIDHFGGLAHIAPQTPAKIGIHELDLRNLTNFNERLTMVSKQLRHFLIESGFDGPKIEELLDLYMLPKSLFESVSVDFTYGAINNKLGPLEFFHVPGHSAGHVVIRLHDLLFSGDHVLQEITPHVSPEKLTMNTGLRHYLQSLQKLKDWTYKPQLTLGGHLEPIEDLDGRIDELFQVYERRLKRTLDLLESPHTVSELSRELFNRHDGYDFLLAVEEAGAYIEYLYQLGVLAIENLTDIQSNGTPTIIRYRRLSKDIPPIPQTYS